MKKLTASDAQAGDVFGRSVAVSGDTAVVGASGEDAGGDFAGAAYVFQRDQGGAGNWGEVKKLLASDAQADDFFGVSVAVSGDTAVVGATGEDAGAANAGAAYVFEPDDDGDGVPNLSDNCPAVPNGDQSLPPWPVTLDGSDPDCDGWSTANENFIGTNPNLACSTDNWPPDFNDSLQVDIFDVLFLAPPVFFSTPPGPPYDARLDLNADGTIIDIFDVLTMAPPIFFATCTP